MGLLGPLLGDNFSFTPNYFSNNIFFHLLQLFHPLTIDDFSHKRLISAYNFLSPINMAAENKERYNCRETEIN